MLARMKAILLDQPSLLIESDPDRIINFSIADLNSMRNRRMDVESFLGALFHEEQRYICHIAVIDEVLEGVWPFEDG